MEPLAGLGVYEVIGCLEFRLNLLGSLILCVRRTHTAQLRDFILLRYELLCIAAK